MGANEARYRAAAGTELRPSYQFSGALGDMKLAVTTVRL